MRNIGKLNNGTLYILLINSSNAKFHFQVLDLGTFKGNEKKLFNYLDEDRSGAINLAELDLDAAKELGFEKPPMLFLTFSNFNIIFG